MNREAASEADERHTVLSQLHSALQEDEDQAALVAIARWDHLEKAALVRVVESGKLRLQAEEVLRAARDLGSDAGQETARTLGPICAGLTNNHLDQAAGDGPRAEDGWAEALRAVAAEDPDPRARLAELKRRLRAGGGDGGGSGAPALKAH